MFVVHEDKSDTVSLCWLSWDEVFTLEAVLIWALYESKNDNELLDKIDDILTILETAEQEAITRRSINFK